MSTFIYYSLRTNRV